MTEIILHGALGKRFGQRHFFNIGKPIDAIRALMANRKGFRAALKTWGRQGRLYEIICDGKLIENEQELLNSRNIQKLELVPTIMGTSKVIKIIVGVILVIVGVIFEQPWLIAMGVGLIVGGILEILFPVKTPSFYSEVAGRSFLFGSSTNSTTRGAPVQIGYGRLRVGSQVISTVLEPSRLGGGNYAGWNGGYNYIGDRSANLYENTYLD